jgi:HAD superfamily hydrolase (TIGR01509 family)
LGGFTQVSGLPQPLLNALIFDVDGTLAETERDGHRVAFNLAFQEFDLPWDWSVGLYADLLKVTGGKERVLHYIHRYQSGFEADLPLMELATLLHQSKGRYFRELLQTHTMLLRPGIKRLIADARRQRVRLAIATTSARETVLPLLERLLGVEAPSWFEVIATGDDVVNKKPAPEVYHLVLETLALSPDQCLVIEDSQQGLRAAVAAGLTTVVTVNDYTRYQSMPQASLVINHLGEPHRPFEVLWGNAGEAYYFSLELAQLLLSSAVA